MPAVGLKLRKGRRRGRRVSVMALPDHTMNTLARGLCVSDLDATEVFGNSVDYSAIAYAYTIPKMLLMELILH